MKSVVVIPARYASSRLPGKPLIEIKGKSVLFRTFEQCAKVFPKDDIYVATDDEKIAEHCDQFGMKYVMTSTKCLTGTDRLAEAALQIEADTFINVQGDEPLIDPEDIVKINRMANEHPESILNGYAPILSEDMFRSRSIPKVVFRQDKRLLYMSRAPVPATKEGDFLYGWRQICVYAFPKEWLAAFAKRGYKTLLEESEDIEILRFLEMGYEIQMVELSNRSIAVDVPEDVRKVEEYLDRYEIC